MQFQLELAAEGGAETPGMAAPSQAKQLECAEKLPDGAVIRLRLIRHDDEPLLQDLAAHMTPEDLRLRFFAAMRGLTHELAAQLSHIDHDRDAAVLAFAEDAEEVLGVARFSADPDHRIAEFAIAVRSDRKRHGLGHLLMARLIQLARQRDIDALVGEVLPENAAMLKLCREFGFTVTIDPRDPKLRLASKTLQDPRSSSAGGGRVRSFLLHEDYRSRRVEGIVSMAISPDFCFPIVNERVSRDRL